MTNCVLDNPLNHYGLLEDKKVYLRVEGRSSDSKMTAAETVETSVPNILSQDNLQYFQHALILRDSNHLL